MQIPKQRKKERRIHNSLQKGLVAFVLHPLYLRVSHPSPTTPTTCDLDFAIASLWWTCQPSGFRFPGFGIVWLLPCRLHGQEVKGKSMEGFWQ